jgi:hypothetical protein
MKICAGCNAISSVLPSGTLQAASLRIGHGNPHPVSQQLSYLAIRRRQTHRQPIARKLNNRGFDGESARRGARNADGSSCSCDNQVHGRVNIHVSVNMRFRRLPPYAITTICPTGCWTIYRVVIQASIMQSFFSSSTMCRRSYGPPGAALAFPIGNDLG